MSKGKYQQLRVLRSNEGVHWGFTGTEYGEWLELVSFKNPEFKKYMKRDDYIDEGNRYRDTIPVFRKDRLVRDGVKVDVRK